MKTATKDLQAHLHSTLTTLLGSGYTMLPAKVTSLRFFKEGQAVWFLPRFQMIDLKWGTIVGYLLWARLHGWDKVELVSPDIPIWLGIGQLLYSKAEETEIRRLLTGLSSIPYWKATSASHALHAELWYGFIKDKQQYHDHYVNIYNIIHAHDRKAFTGKPYPVYNYTSKPMNSEEYHKRFAAKCNITVEHSRALEAKVMTVIK